MNPQQIALRLKVLLQKGQFETAQRELFAENATSKEPEKTRLPAIIGIENILVKGKNFRDSVSSFHSIVVSEPMVSGSFIALALQVELTFKASDEKSKMDEIILYMTENGKIVEETFFY